MPSSSASPPALLLACAGIALCAWACGSGGSTGEAARRDDAPIALLAAFPAEMAAILERTIIEETRPVAGRTVRFGRLGGVRVAVTMTGIGLENARSTTRAVLDGIAPAGVVVSAVAGSSRRIGDVLVPASWRFGDEARDGEEPPGHDVDEGWLRVAAEAAASGEVLLERCAIIPERAPFDVARPGDRVCLPDRPRVILGGIGSSSDPYGGRPLACEPGGDDVFGCDGEEARPFPGVSAGDAAVASAVRAADGEGIAVDMETAAIAAEAAARGLPFIAFRAASDGTGDPLGLAGFSQFFAYYRLASHNAAAATEAFLSRLARGAGAGDRSTR